MTPCRAVWIASVAALLLLAGGVPAAGQSRCDAAKFKAAGKYGHALASCQAKAEKKARPVETACLVKAEEKLAKRWARALRKGDCATTDEQVAARLRVEERIDELTRLLREDPVCCEFPPGIASCGYLPPVVCEIADWPMGLPGDNCHPPTGTCGPVAVDPGACCEFRTIYSASPQCMAGPALDAPFCTDLDGTFSAAAGCTRTGSCQ